MRAVATGAMLDSAGANCLSAPTTSDEAFRHFPQSRADARTVRPRPGSAMSVAPRKLEAATTGGLKNDGRGGNTF